MEHVHRSCKVSNFAPEDVISNLPDFVINNILEHLPLQDAMRTSILSRNWRSKWTMLTQLVFDEDFYEYLRETGNGNNYGTIISRLLPHYTGALTKFVLYIPYTQEDNHAVDVKDINKWVFFLSQKEIQEFTLKNMHKTPLELPNLFSCLKLRYLKLFNCHFCPGSSFNGFPSLLSLYLSEVIFGSYTCGEILARCPLLEILKLRSNTGGKIKRVEINQLENLKVLTLQLREYENEENEEKENEEKENEETENVENENEENENEAIITCSSIFQFIGYFPKLQELNLNFWKRKLTTDARMSVLTALPYIKTLRLYEIDFSNETMVSFAIDLICGTPNLETLLIKAPYEDDDTALAVSSLKVDFKRMRELQLREAKFVSVRCIKNDVCLMKSLLACSPLLKKMVINPKSLNVFGGDDGKRKFVTELMLHRASRIAEIIID
ncbi:putative F-box-like domain superfamily protein [Tanacetum coccineum]